MTEKQRWLLRDLEAWREKQLARIGKYGPRREPKEPPPVKAARQAAKRAEIVIHRWDTEKRQQWEKAREAVAEQAEAVKRVILFEKTDAALKALRSLKVVGEKGDR